MTFIFFLLLVGIFVFEFINGFHDTANAVATVIYTKSLKPKVAVVFSGLLNLLGVLVGGVGVAYTIVKLFPLQQLTTFGPGMAVIFTANLLAVAIFRNRYTWKHGLPCSSSHTLIGAIVGAVLGFCFLKLGGDTSLVNWAKIKDILLGLLISPIFGFGITFLLVSLLGNFFKKTVLFHIPSHDDHTPPWIMRIMLIISCGLVSFFHGSNDGQKGIGLTMATLVLLFPLEYQSFIADKTAPLRVIGMISIALGLGTMIGWKRIVLTIGEKIGIDHLSYIQGLVSELVTSFAIGMSTFYHLPVSTTHVLSSGVAGSMVASGGFKNIQVKTVKNILSAWLLTLPVTILSAAGLVWILGKMFL